MSLAAGDGVLDIECGTGTDTLWLAAHGFEAVGIDIASRGIELARQKAEREAVSNIRFEAADIFERAPVDPVHPNNPIRTKSMPTHPGTDTGISVNPQLARAISREMDGASRDLRCWVWAVAAGLITPPLEHIGDEDHR